MGFLCAIEQLGHKNKSIVLTPKVTTVKKGERELKNLVSTINYERGSSKRQTVNSGGPMLLTCQ